MNFFGHLLECIINDFATEKIELIKKSVQIVVFTE